MKASLPPSITHFTVRTLTTDLLSQLSLLYLRITIQTEDVSILGLPLLRELFLQNLNHSFSLSDLPSLRVLTLQQQRLLLDSGITNQVRISPDEFESSNCFLEGL